MAKKRKVNKIRLGRIGGIHDKEIKEVKRQWKYQVLQVKDLDEFLPEHDANEVIEEAVEEAAMDLELQKKRKAEERAQFIINQEHARKRQRIRNARQKNRDKNNMNSLANKNRRSIYHVDSLSLWDIFTGKRAQIRVSVGKADRVLLQFDDIFIAYDGKYRTLLEFAEIYDDEDGEFAIALALSDAAIEAYNKINPRRNTSTNKDRYLNSMYATPTEHSKSDAKG